MGHVSPALLTTMRWFFAVLVVLPFAMPHLKRELPALKPYLPFLFVLGSVGFAIFNNIMYLALNYTSAINVGIEQASMPLFVFMLNFALFRIKTNLLQLVGFTLTVLGVVLTISNGNPLSLISQPANFGDLIMIGAIIAYAGYSVALRNKPVIHWLSFIAILSFSALITSLFFLAFEFYQQSVIAPDWRAMSVVLYVAIFPSIIAQSLWIRGLELIGSNRGGVFINFVPVFSSIFAILILGERFQFYHALSLILVIGGIALAQPKK